MALVALDGQFCVPIGAGHLLTLNAPSAQSIALDATNESAIFIGRIVTSDGASHTIDTSGSSTLGWLTGAITFANGGTTVKIGLANVLATVGPPGRPNNAADVISFDVSASRTGGGGGITGSAWQSHVPDSGTKTIANGDLVAFAIQMTARGGTTDSITVVYLPNNLGIHRPIVVSFVGGSYTLSAGMPNAIITFADGALGYFHVSEVFSAQTTRTWNSGDATKEYGQLFKLPFPTKIYGAWGWVNPANDCDIVLYSDPLGTPVAEKTVFLDKNTVGAGVGRKFFEFFSSPYTTIAGQNVGIVFKPGAGSAVAYYRTLANASHRVGDPWGINGYGISRASGAFGNANSSLDHYYIGLLVGAFEHGVQPTYGLGI